jgi:hypothetical protein
MADQFICTLHTQHSCSEQSYSIRECRLDIDQKYIIKSCPYRIKAIVIISPMDLMEKKEIKDESPTPVPELDKEVF